MLHLLTGRAGSGKTLALLNSICQHGAERPQVLLVPEQASHEMERLLCVRGGSSVSLYAEVLSFTRLAGRVFSVCGGVAEPVLDGGGRILLMNAALRAAGGALTVYARPSRAPAFLNGLLGTVDELKSCCITPEMLARMGAEIDGVQGDKLRDLSLLYGAYDALTAQVAMDPKDRLSRLAVRLESCLWAEGKDVYVNGFTDFTPQEEQVLRRLIAQANSVTVALTCEQANEEGLFSIPNKTGRALRRLAELEGVPVITTALQQKGNRKAEPLMLLERELFSIGEDQPGQAGESIVLFRAGSPRTEVEWTAAKILELLRRDGYRLRDIAVTARSMEGYEHLIDTVFRRYGIPVFHSGMTDILRKPVMALVTAALDTVAGGYRYEDVFRYLKTGLTGISAEDCDKLENYSLKWNIRGRKWTSEADWTMHPRGYGFQPDEWSQVVLTHLNAIRRRVTAPLERLRLSAEKTGRGQAMALYTFLEEIQLPDRLEERTSQLRQRGEMGLADEYAQLWDILCGGLEQCAMILGDTPMEREEFAGLFPLVLSQYDVGTIPVSLDRVTAGELPRVAGRRCKVLFLLGADDGSIPRVTEDSGFLSDEDRELLAEYGMPAAMGAEDRLNREMMYAYSGCTRPTDKLFVTWPSGGGSGGENRPAFLVSRMKKLFSDLRVEEEETLGDRFRLVAPRPALELAGRYPAVKNTLGKMPEYAPLLERMERAGGWERGKLSRAAVEKLYGARVPMSASRMDKYKSCHFSYFMQYGLKAEPRKSAGFSAPEYGTFIHFVLERVVQKLPPKSTAEERRVLARDAVEHYVTEELGDLGEQTPRFRYLFRRLLKTVYLIVDNVAEELEHAQFQPLSFELGFGRDGDLPPVEVTESGITISLTGFVDRVDGWIRGDKLYLRVVDYKTGKKPFDLAEIWSGMGLQMLLYLFTLQNEGTEYYGKEIVPAGVLYLPAREAVASGSRRMTEEERKRQTDKALVRHGLILDDIGVLQAMEAQESGGYCFLPVKAGKDGTVSGECLASAARLGQLKRHTEKILSDICTELEAGDIQADPFWRGPDKNACRWCDYAVACHFEEGRGGDCRRWMGTMKADEFWTNMEQECE